MLSWGMCRTARNGCATDTLPGGIRKRRAGAAGFAPGVSDHAVLGHTPHSQEWLCYRYVDWAASESGEPERLASLPGVSDHAVLGHTPHSQEWLCYRHVAA